MLGRVILIFIAVVILSCLAGLILKILALLCGILLWLGGAIIHLIGIGGMVIVPVAIIALAWIWFRKRKEATS